MPNWCCNDVEFHHKNPRQIARLVKAACKGRLLSEFVPIDPEAASSDSIPHLRNVGDWGTKWDALPVDESAIDVSEDGLTARFAFDTASGPPIGWYEQLTGFTITAYYYEPGLDFCGKWTSEDGGQEYLIEEHETLEDLRARIPEDIILRNGIDDEFLRRDEDPNPLRRIRKNPDSREAVLDAVCKHGYASLYTGEVAIKLVGVLPVQICSMVLAFEEHDWLAVFENGVVNLLALLRSYISYELWCHLCWIEDIVSKRGDEGHDECILCCLFRLDEVLGLLDAVELQARINRVLLQIERGDLDCLLLIGSQAGQAVGEGVGDAELH